MVISKQSKLNDFRKKTKERYAAVLHFNGLNSVAYGSLKNKIKNDWVTTRLDTVPHTIAGNIKMVDGYVDPRMGKRVRSNTQLGVAFISPAEEQATTLANNNNKDNNNIRYNAG